MSGSRDLGAQLFCALLRSVAVDTRLVFSLQPLPFSGVAKGATPETAKPQYIYASSTTNQLPCQASSAEKIASPSNPRWRASEFAAEEQFPHPPLPRAPSSKSRIKDSPYPIFWVEVFSPSIDKWIPVDPLVRHTFNKPRTGYEPPASDGMNGMSYVIAFQDDGSARDVTRRYASQYNAKTRKLRVESTKGGEKWWKRTMEFLERPFPETRDEIELNELAAREAQEGMPKNLGDFKGHPIFALERHLRRNEVISPLREAGKIGTGPGGKVEPVYRRRDVHVVRSADQWYRKGRDVKEGEQPLKRAIVRQSKRDTPMGEDGVDDYGAGLYAEFQTDVYVPPPVVNRQIPRNAYGNLDVYVPSMIPAGAIHLQHPLAARAAKIMGMDYADAVTGFDFKGRQGTAVVNGIIAAQESREALIEVIKRMEQEQAEAEQEKRTNLALQMWKTFMTALRIRDKIDKEYADAGSDEDMADLTYDGNDSGDGRAGGGFVPDADMNDEAIVSFASQSPLRPASFPFVPSEMIIVESPHQLEKPGLEVMQQKWNSLDSLFEEPDSPGNDGASPTGEISDEQPGGFLVEEDVDGEGGGFVPEEDDDQGGRFILNETDDAQGSGMLSEGHRHEPCTATAAQGLQVAVGGDSVLAPRPDPPGISVSLLDAVEKSDSNAMPDRQEKSSALVDEMSALTPRDIGSTGSSDSLDNESLLSHDPEDEDAEPEWLLDAEGL
jgi:xeroderma pigmentosum group C-complementing protein